MALSGGDAPIPIWPTNDSDLDAVAGARAAAREGAVGGAQPGDARWLDEALSRVFARARREGFASCDFGEVAAATGVVERAVSSLGQPLSCRGNGGVQGLDTLVPLAGAHAQRNSLSSRHGLGSFPFHSDGAHWAVPPRWVVMWCVADEERRPTLVVPWCHVRSASRGAPVVVLKARHASRYLELGNEARFDASVMMPANLDARGLFEAVRAPSMLASAVTIDWVPGRILVLDNHAVLHARGTPSAAGRRVLRRALFREIRDDCP